MADSSVKEYLAQTVQSHLTKALVELHEQKPAKPFAFLANFFDSVARQHKKKTAKVTVFDGARFDSDRVRVMVKRAAPLIERALYDDAHAASLRVRDLNLREAIVCFASPSGGDETWVKVKWGQSYLHLHFDGETKNLKVIKGQTREAPFV
mmetsp:Transcript_22784/g.25325  ORF Transcript_22784/g.25325 Transcript_22784/m.25325 type:complete len:151 (-) Transcript_22784:29-481(-)|eukprot:CAMPEP_0205825934 /NCGR_PEP_ID=MMETSP0206-20130828/26909_1 /ASSEMBLY_ACC=CAM_ASM_000279 /TAXON_ID=36767 /ORGANISM="Euplotes focardii, Strain TN1" /LENGTH=150 /DNA_ID=CAMNT_0053125383 /DNA_START=20 /DNA_END=472 /DNA_ORIENTATION=+